MYLIGAPHQLKTDSQLLLERSIGEGQRLVTDVEVLHEILHRYAAIDRRDAIEPAFEALLGIVDDVLPIDKSDALRASQIAQSRHRLSARNAMHIAVMERYQIGRIMSFDQDFDRWPGIVRLFAV